MKTMLYPKTYATLIDIQTIHHDCWILSGGKLIRPSRRPLYIFQADDGTIIEQENPGTSGGTPNRISAAWYKYLDDNFGPWPSKARSKARWCDFLISLKLRVKLYQRPQLGKRWYFRHMGC